MVSKNRESTDEKLRRVVKERCSKILEGFERVSVLNVKNSKFLEALEDIKRYWKDVSRPALTSFSCEAVGGAVESAEGAGVMFILASSGFGIHDDIIDQSMSKHFRMTVLGLHGVDTALLVGDLLIGKTLTVVSNMLRNTRDAVKVADVLEVYSILSLEACEAELMETFCRRKVDTDLDYYKDVLWQAMAETEACSRIGAMLGGGTKEEIEALAEFGRRLGFVSRLSDDIEDCLNLKGDLIHRIEYESIPLPLLYAAKASQEIQVQIKKIVEKPHVTPSDARMLLQFCFETEAFNYVCNIAEENKAEASRLLDLLEASEARDVLSSMFKNSIRHICKLCI